MLRRFEGEGVQPAVWRGVLRGERGVEVREHLRAWRSGWWIVGRGAERGAAVNAQRSAKHFRARRSGQRTPQSVAQRRAEQTHSDLELELWRDRDVSDAELGSVGLGARDARRRGARRVVAEDGRRVGLGGALLDERVDEVKVLLDIWRSF
eukprot:1732896-Rhodomonas_salina.1